MNKGESFKYKILEGTPKLCCVKNSSQVFKLISFAFVFRVEQESKLSYLIKPMY